MGEKMTHNRKMQILLFIPFLVILIFGGVIFLPACLIIGARRASNFMNRITNPVLKYF